MSEDHRSRLYAWVREHNDEALAEYFMSCIAPASLADLVTKEFLTAELSRFATKGEMQAGFDRLWAQRETDRAEAAAQREADRAAREADRAEWAAQREADRAEAVAQREADRAESRHQFRWVIGTFFAAVAILVTAMTAFVAAA